MIFWLRAGGFAQILEGIPWGEVSIRASRPSLGAQVLAVFSFISSGKSHFKKLSGKTLEVPDTLLPDICGILTVSRGFSGFAWAFLANYQNSKERRRSAGVLPSHPRVVSIQAWFLARRSSTRTRASRLGSFNEQLDSIH